MHVAVAIVAYRNLADVERCLAALESSTYRDFEVVICENGGVEAHQELQRGIHPTLRSGQPVKLLCAPGNIGYGAGVNVCLRASPQADAWWVLNPDTLVDPEALGRLVGRLAAGDRDAVGGTIFFPDGKVESYGGQWSPMTARSHSIGYGSRVGDAVVAADIERDLSYLSGASVLVGRKFVERVGFLREDYFLYCEEVEWFLRGGSAGMRLGFAPGAKVLHFQGTTTGSVASLRERPRLPVYLDIRNRLLLTRDRFPTLVPIAALAILGLQGLRCVRHRAWRQLGYVAAGWIAGLRDERGPPSWLGLAQDGRPSALP